MPWSGWNVSIALAVLAMQSPCVPAADLRPRCSAEAAAAAEKDASQLRSWPAIYESFRKYRGCDDGAVAEGYTESISVMLEVHWAALAALVKLAREDQQFDTFVVGHLNELVPAKRLQAIKANARDRCARDARSICTRIVSAIDALEIKGSAK